MVVRLATRGVSVGFEFTKVNYDNVWHGAITVYRISVGEDTVCRSFALGFEIGLGLVGADLSATASRPAWVVEHEAVEYFLSSVCAAL